MGRRQGGYINEKKSAIISENKVVLEPAEEGGYTVYVPALPGCISEGNTFEAITNIREAVELYLEPDEDERF